MRKICALLVLSCLVAGQDAGGKRNVKAAGGSDRTEGGVRTGLDFFVANQRADGGWGDAESQVAPTGLSLLAFLGAGWTDRGAGTHETAVKAGFRYLLRAQQDDGGIGGAVRDHAIATLALGEVYWMTRNPRYKLPAEKALAWLLRQRQADGSFGDVQSTGWAAAALKSCKFGGLAIQPEALGAVKRWFESRPGAGRDAAIGLFARIMAGEDPQGEAFRRGLDACLEAMPGDDRIYWYFGTLAAFQCGGTHWKRWNEAMKPALLDSQRDDGSWDPVGKPEETGGRVGETALLMMCLEVYYRYDRVFGTAGEEGLRDAPFDGPTTNAGIGLGGGAGGSFRGRGGKRKTLGVQRVRRPFHTEGYDRIDENPFRRVDVEDTSTFSIDVDTASYANVRRFLRKEFHLPPKDAVRTEELINYFTYDYAAPAPDAEHPFAVHAEVATCPWNAKHRLARIALQGKRLDAAARPAANLVFLLDVSGSMKSADKLPLLREAMGLLVRQLEPRDRVAIVVYAGAAGLILPPTPCDRKEEILAAIARLEAGGSTAGGEGIQLAYRVAAGSFLEGGLNRVVLCTDGDFNVGVTDHGALTRLIEEQAKSGVFLSVLGFGTGNLKDDLMEQLSNKGNGNYAYVDTLAEARKVLVREMSGTLFTIAKDVKIQVFFNPARVAGYRLVGYENRLLAKEDFNDDKKDAGEIGAGHSVTALYEIVPAGADVPGRAADENPFVRRAAPAGESAALFRLRVRYKPPEADESVLLESDVLDGGRGFGEASRDFRWAAAVAQFGMLLRGSPGIEGATWDGVLELAGSAKGEDPHGYRAGFLELANAAKRLAALASEG